MTAEPVVTRREFLYTPGVTAPTEGAQGSESHSAGG